MEQSKIKHEKKIEGINFIINYDGHAYIISKICKFIFVILIIAFIIFIYHAFKFRIEKQPDLMLLYGIIAALCSYVLTGCLYRIYHYLFKMPYYNFIRLVNKIYDIKKAILIRIDKKIFRIQGNRGEDVLHIKIPDVEINKKTVSSGRTIINVYKEYIEIILMK